MCGRFVFAPGEYQKFQQRFEIGNELPVEDRYNIAPGQLTPVVTRKSPNQAENMKWGLIPFWANDPKIGYKMINARAETVASKPAFRKPFRVQRCLVPANGFYEWKRDNGKQPFFVRLQDNSLISFSGIYDIWQDAEGHPIKSFSIITTEPNDEITPIHNRMPVILSREDEAI